MDDSLTHIAGLLGLGRISGPERGIKGGLLHRAWRIETTSGSYLFKQLNRAIAAKRSALARSRAGEGFAATLAKQGIPAVSALTLEGDPILPRDGAHWMVFPWVEGTTLAAGGITAAHATTIGGTLAAIHRLALSPSGLGELEQPFVTDAEWTSLTRASGAAGTQWTAALAGARGELRVAGTRAEAAFAAFREPTLASHRDLDPTNVIWRPDGSPALVDWEAAGTIHPSLELVRAVFDWSANADGSLERARFVALVEGYRSQGGVLGEAAAPLVDAALGAMLPWLAYNLRLSLGAGNAASDERRRADDAARESLSRLRALVAGRGEWISWLRKAQV